jgi:hypothetical protein
VQFALHIAIMPMMPCTRKRGQFPLEGQEAGRLDHDRQAGVPDRGATVCLSRPGPLGTRHQGPQSDAHRPAAQRPGPTATAVNAEVLQDHLPRAAVSARDRDGDTGSRHGTGPAEAPLAQANQAPPESMTNGVSFDFPDYIGSRSTQGPPKPF